MAQQEKLKVLITTDLYTTNTNGVVTSVQNLFDELTAKGEACNMEEILANVKERDYIDSHREVSPLRQADDALVLDNSHMTIPEQKAWLMEKYQERCQ